LKGKPLSTADGSHKNEEIEKIGIKRDHKPGGDTLHPTGVGREKGNKRTKHYNEPPLVFQGDKGVNILRGLDKNINTVGKTNIHQKLMDDAHYDKKPENSLFDNERGVFI
jgi:hypothetical protein